MKQYSVIDRLNHDGKPYEVDDKVELDEATAETLVAAGVIDAKPVGKAEAAPAVQKPLAEMKPAELKKIIAAENVAVAANATPAEMITAIEAARAKAAADAGTAQS